jgi:hypothetical protein
LKRIDFYRIKAQKPTIDNKKRNRLISQIIMNLATPTSILDVSSKESTTKAGGFALAPQGLTGRGYGPFLPLSEL